VCFPLLIGKSQDEKNALTYHYVWQTQVFATADFPKRWEYPLKLALSALENSVVLDTADKDRRMESVEGVLSLSGTQGNS
jgi:hypothetical protein